MASAESWQWQGKTVLITGAGSGLGQTLAIELSHRGVAELVLCDLTESALAKTVAACAKGTKTQTFTFDVRDHQGLKAPLAAVSHIDVAYVNAGILEKPAEYPNGFDAATIQRVVDIDLTSAIVGTTQIAQAMVASKSGKKSAIVLTGSMGAWVPMPLTPVYAASKSGVVHFTKSVAPVAIAQGIRIMAVCPSYTETPMLFDSANTEDVRANMRGEVGGRFLTPAEVVAGMIEIVEIGEAGDLMRVTVRGGRDFGPSKKQRSKL